MKQGHQKLRLFRDRFHSSCIICGRQHSGGMKLPFLFCKDGSVKARFSCAPALQGYHGFLHGGVIAAMLDGAMTNCLFAHWKTAVTASLNVRFLFPVKAKGKAALRAQIKRINPPLYLVESELIQNGRTVARASGKFMEKPEKFFQKTKGKTTGS